MKNDMDWRTKQTNNKKNKTQEDETEVKRSTTN